MRLFMNLFAKRAARQPHRYLVKDSDDFISHCRCKVALASYPAQADCPWCGCGWLFTCMKCKKSFTFARGVITDEPWRELALRDLAGAGNVRPSDDDLDEWVEMMESMMADVIVGERVVYFDGHVIPTDVRGLRATGRHAKHNLDFVPQVEAMRDPAVIESILKSREYWEQHAIQS